ncbi:deoxyribose-phosphate aldolase, partial [Streptosporangium roseum]
MSGAVPGPPGAAGNGGVPGSAIAAPGSGAPGRAGVSGHIGEEGYRALLDIRARFPGRIAEAAAVRRRRGLLEERDRILVIAADHPARGALGVGDRPMAMESRAGLLDRLT